MKKLCVFIAICFFCALQAQTSRNLIVLFDWPTERIATQLDDINWDVHKSGTGPITERLATALAQKAAPIITTSSVWHNFIARRKLVKDFLGDRTLIYKNKYKRFDETTIKKFQQLIKSFFEPTGQSLPNDKLRYEVLQSFFIYYAIPFQENDWIIKKASDYIYVLIPNAYLEQLKKSKELEKSEEQRKVFEEVKKTFKEQNRDKQIKELSDDDLYLGLKISKMEDMSYQDALDPDKHKLSIDQNNYVQLLTQKDMQMIMGLPMPTYMLRESFILSKHFINVLKDIFVTQQDLKDNKDAAKTDLYRALYLHKWHIFLSGHGGESDPGTLQDLDISRVERLPHNQLMLTATSIAGMDLVSFRKWLAFLQSNIKTEFLYYVSCYSGGQHLQTLFEHQWEYSTGTTLKREAKPDIFNYMIVTSNLEYTLTVERPSVVLPSYGRGKEKIIYNIQFPPFFKAIEKYFSIGHIEIRDKKLYFEISEKINKNRPRFVAAIVRDVSGAPEEDLQKKLEDLHFITLNGVIDYVNDVTINQPAVRYPGTDFFVPVPLDEEQQVRARIRFETSAATEARKKEEARVKKLIKEQTEEHVAKQKGETTPRVLIKAIRNLQQSLMQLKQSILK